VAVSVLGRTFTASPLAGGSLGIVLLTLDAGGGRVPSDGSRP
jgi:hypothetical protein